MKPAVSLQRRLSIGLTAGIALLWIIAAIVASLAAREELNETFDSGLEETAQRILPLAVLEIVNREEDGRSQRIAALQPHKEHLTYLVRDKQGKILMQSHDADPAIFNRFPLEGFTDTATHRIYTASALRETLFIEVAERLEHRREAALEAALALFWPLLVLIPLSLLGSWLFVRFSLRSILVYRGAIEARGAGDLSPIRAVQLPAEIDPLARAVNHLLERLRRALDAERSFTANSAHELRTPLAATLAQVQRLHSEAPEGKLRERAAQIEKSLRELARLSEKLMQLAKAEGGSLLPETPQNLLPLLRHVVDELSRSNTAARLALQLPATDTVLASIDADAFAILLRNLIENALKHGAASQPVEIALSADALLRITNAGPVVPAAVLAQLTGRFVRGGSVAEGSGLGLAIAATIARGVGASLALASPATGRADGFEVSVQFTRA
ncbi:sensor histidine kinase [Pseudomonas sp. N040]|uniref:sensor histidine kinase n=1 Tax=Pseudomonas sp. N040 TaxID=2785325 RepID=UPI0018A26741|nr:ATP-binding protein [Pseudomonas sp. N040]MBF7729070.1 sensor histidine kinase N-terminal domain-containing protein [Pseudomonas sp. N040]MBW7012710.1 sensor histidine kinase N-terminal domain-containing protein [Pseudomonas sp. N040]